MQTNSTGVANPRSTIRTDGTLRLDHGMQHPSIMIDEMGMHCNFLGYGPT
jgi:hypothetical protein